MKIVFFAILLTRFAHFSIASFVENAGQITKQDLSKNEDVLFLHQQPGLKVQLRKDGFSYEIFSISDNEFSEKAADEYENVLFDYQTHRIDFSFPNSPSSIERNRKKKNRVNVYLNGHHFSNIYSFDQIIYYNVFPNVDIEFLVNDEGTFKYNIHCHNQTDCEMFSLALDGGSNLFIDLKESLVFETNEAVLEETIPLSYIVNQKGKRKLTKSEYKLVGNQIFYSVPSFDDSELLIIDPEPEGVWGTYYGGSEYDIATTIMGDATNHIYHAGMTMSFNFIATAGAHETSYQGGLDGYLAKYDSEGNLLWSTYFGGPQTDRPYALTTDDLGNMYLGGASYSETGIATPGSYQLTIEGVDDLFIAKFNTSGELQWGSYLGGTGHDFITEMVCFNNQLFLTGHTTSINGIGTVGTFLPNNTANETAYLISFSTDGTAKNWGTYIGGSNNSSGEGLALLDNSIVVGGRTAATSGIATVGTHQYMLNGFGNGFLQRFDLTGNIIWGSYYGGAFTDKIYDLTIDEDNNIYVTGDASSTTGIATPDAYQPTRLSSEQGFLGKFSENGMRIWGTYLGGTSTDYITSIACHDSLLVVVGKTLSTNNIATQSAFKDTLTGGYDGFFNGFTSDGAYLWGSYIGGLENEGIEDVYFDTVGNFYIAGDVSGASMGIVFGNAHQGTFGGASSDGYLMKFCREKQVKITFSNGYLIASGASDYEWFLDGVSLSIFSDSIVPITGGNYSIEGSFQGGCTTISNGFNYSTVGIKQFSQHIHIYPNPLMIGNSLYISSSDPIRKVQIIGIDGKFIELQTQVSTTNKYHLEIDTVEPGIYIVNIFTDYNVFENKLLIF